MNSYKIEWTFQTYVGKTATQIDVINARTPKQAVDVLKSNYSFAQDIQIQNVWIDKITVWEHVTREEWEA